MHSQIKWAREDLALRGEWKAINANLIQNTTKLMHVNITKILAKAKGEDIQNKEIQIVLTYEEVLDLVNDTNAEKKARRKKIRLHKTLQS